MPSPHMVAGMSKDGGCSLADLPLHVLELVVLKAAEGATEPRGHAASAFRASCRLMRDMFDSTNNQLASHALERRRRGL